MQSEHSGLRPDTSSFVLFVDKFVYVSLLKIEAEIIPSAEILNTHTFLIIRLQKKNV